MCSVSSVISFASREQIWTHALQTVDKSGSGMKTKDLVVRRSGWKTVRVFVSSTFRDFHAEREILVKKVRSSSHSSEVSCSECVENFHDIHSKCLLCRYFLTCVCGVRVEEFNLSTVI